MHLDEHNIDDGLRNPKPSRVPLRVDDEKIRKELFSDSAQLLAKIRKLEKDHSDFQLWDQTLFQDWRNLNFRDEIHELELLQKRHRILTTFEVHLNYVATTSSVTLQQAYNMLKEEESQYQSGDDIWRFVIDNLRKGRFQTAVQSPSQNPAEDEPVDFAEIFFKDDSVLSGLKRRARSVYHYLNDIDDGKMVQHLEVPMAGYRLFKESLQIAMKCGDWRLLGRVWKTASPAYQQRYLRNLPLHLKKFLKKIIDENEHEEALQQEQSRQKDVLLQTYNKLSRWLHPDRQRDQSIEQQQWASIKWQRVQAAYDRRDEAALRRIDLLCRAETGQLNDLTVDEIQQSSLILKEEFEALQESLVTCRKHPAWRFSSRRSYTALKNQVHQDLQKQLKPLRAQVLVFEETLKGFASSQGQ
ncbi:hypothetical protein [Bdellovibrio sp. HCB274]|uniref:hypothetical protein n=1 Tax=Bdellovibrio sp. HCB274 TaxID=3394361 RepID=UPI0039B4B894